MASEKTIGVKGKVVSAQSREVIANVIKFMKKEACNRSPIIPITNFKQRVLEATGISKHIYEQVSQDLARRESEEEKPVEFEFVSVN
ncbi:unnamed protein product [Tenebrio molitor]|jgi:hypothetical protein|nr:unnamed protein product [Tenebrio molitor]